MGRGVWIFGCDGIPRRDHFDPEVECDAAAASSGYDFGQICGRRSEWSEIMNEVVKRYAGNPILTPEMIPGANAVFNSAVAKFGEKYVGVFRVEKREGFQSLRVAW